MIFLRSVLSLLVLVSQTALSQDRCMQFTNAIESSQKYIAQIQWGDGLFDSSAPRATMRELQMNNQLQLISMNLSLMTQHKCPAIERPVNMGSAYISAAIECGGKMKQSVGSRELPVECKRENWKPENK